MKFAVVVAITLALAMGAQSSLIPLAHHSLGHLDSPVLLVSSPLLHAVPHSLGSVAIHASAVPPQLVAHHGAVVVDSHSPVVHIAPAIEGQYIAKTRGAVHKAPLPGHVASAASINLAPAPGTV